MSEKTNANSEKTGTIVDHLTALRKRLIIIVVVNLAFTLICYNFIPPLIEFFIKLNPGMNLVYISPEELFMVYVKIALLCGVVFASPVTILEIWEFIRSGLYKGERRSILIALFLGLFFFLIGAVFSYRIVLPIILGFFIRIRIESIQPMVSIEKYVNFCITMLLCFGAAFELPVITYVLSEFEILKPETLKRLHGALIVIVWVIAAIITPPDVASQILLGLPMTALLELSILICQWVNQKKQRSKTS